MGGKASRLRESLRPLSTRARLLPPPPAAGAGAPAGWPACCTPAPLAAAAACDALSRDAPASAGPSSACTVGCSGFETLCMQVGFGTSAKRALQQASTRSWQGCLMLAADSMTSALVRTCQCQYYHQTTLTRAARM